MDSSTKYKLELNSYFVLDDEEKSDLSAKFLYGKFLNYLSDDDYVGASLAKSFLRRGNLHCSQKGYKDSKFNCYYHQSKDNNKLKDLRETFFYDGVGRREGEVETTLSETCQK